MFKVDNLGYRYAGKKPRRLAKLHQSISLERPNNVANYVPSSIVFLQWHAETQIPAYYALLKAGAGSTLKTVDSAMSYLSQYSEQVMQFWYDFRLELLPYAEGALSSQIFLKNNNAILLVSLQERLQEDDKPKSVAAQKIRKQETNSHKWKTVLPAPLGGYEQSQKDYIQVWANRATY